jgi:phosphohistidine swiveling domain-containing protein
MKYLVNLHTKKPPASIGNKAASLHQLWKKGYPIPNTYVCTWDAFQDDQRQVEEVLASLRLELSQVLAPDRAYAVRSSANIEDSLERSFAGQFSTFLDIRGVERVLDAIQEIWRDTQSHSVSTYLTRTDGNHLELKMAVIIQEMIPSIVSGVSFSKNPITTLDEVIIEAVEGQGTSLVQGGITPLRWVNKWGGWIASPENAPVQIQVIEQIVRQTRKIARAFRKEVDLEWVYDGQQVYWLQLRDITSINITYYSNRMAKEMIPGLIPPLVWSVSVPIPCQAWVNLIGEAIGKNDLEPGRLVRAFHYRAYFNMAVLGQIFISLGLPPESLEMMLGITHAEAGKPPMKPSMQTMRRIPSLLRFAYDKCTLGARLGQKYPLLYQQAHEIPLPSPVEQSEAQMLQTIEQVKLVNLELAYYTVVSTILMQIYNRILRGRLKKIGVDFQNFDLTAGMDELNEVDPTVNMLALHQAYLDLPPAARAAVQASDLSALLALPEACSFGNDFSAFLVQFGHLSDTTGHFGSPPWRETPGLILQWIAKYQAPAPAHQTRLRYAELPKRSPMLRLFYQRARQFRLFREQYSLLYSYSLMLFRAYYLAIGESFVGRGLLGQASDILFLYDDEVRAAIADQSSGSDFANLVTARQQEFEQDRAAILPDVIFGEVAPLILPDSAGKLSGVPTSKGYYTGKACIIQSLNDFDKLDNGDILVIPFSDVSWTPLFAKAGGVVAESGGILSHSSIIAREYNIPAVVSVVGALQLPDGATITVDGFRGEVLIHETLPVELQPVIQENAEE